MSTSVTRAKSRPRIVTIVWGATILALATLLLLGQLVSLAIDPVVVALGLLIGVGLSLVAGGLLSLRSRPTTDDTGGPDLGADRRTSDDPDGPTRFDDPAY